MDRRSFLKHSALALFGFTVLPPAKTYERIWKATIAPGIIINPAWIDAPYEASFLLTQEILDEWKRLILPRRLDTDSLRVYPSNQIDGIKNRSSRS